MARLCEKVRSIDGSAVPCGTPLDEAGRCVTCEADAEGLKLLTRYEFATVREMMAHLETRGLAPEMEKVPPANEQQVHLPLWNLYVPEAEVPAAREILTRHWAELLDAPEAAAAAARGQAGIDLDKGGEVACPACGHTFTVSSREAECPECGLGLGLPAGLAPDEAKS